MSTTSLTNMLLVNSTALYPSLQIESDRIPTDEELILLFHQKTDKPIQDPLIPLFKRESHDPLPSKTDLIVRFCQETMPSKPKNESTQRVENHYVKEFGKLQPTDKLDVLARISPAYFVRLFFSKLPPDMRKIYIETASLLAPTSENPTQLRLDTITNCKTALASKDKVESAPSPRMSPVDYLVLYCGTYPTALQEKAGQDEIVKLFDPLSPLQKLEVIQQVANKEFKDFLRARLPEDMVQRYVGIYQSIQQPAQASSTTHSAVIDLYIKELQPPQS